MAKAAELNLIMQHHQELLPISHLASLDVDIASEIVIVVSFYGSLYFLCCVLTAKLPPPELLLFLAIPSSCKVILLDHLLIKCPSRHDDSRFIQYMQC